MQLLGEFAGLNHRDMVGSWDARHDQRRLSFGASGSASASGQRAVKTSHFWSLIFISPRPGATALLQSHALGSWSEFAKSVPHTFVGCTNALPSNWERYSQRPCGALPNSLSERLTEPSSPLAL